MKHFPVLALATLIAACSDVGPGLANHPGDCALGFAWADCLPGTAGYKPTSAQLEYQARQNGTMTYATQGQAAKARVRDEMEQSRAAYKACLAQNPQNVSACEGLRLAYEADLEAYRATSAGVRPGASYDIHSSADH